MAKFILSFLILIPTLSNAQVQSKVQSGLLLLDEQTRLPLETRYGKTLTFLKKSISADLKDTTTLFTCALLLNAFNNVMARPASEVNAVTELKTALKMATRARELKMTEPKLIVLLAWINKNLCYQLLIEPKYNLKNVQLKERAAAFNTYKINGNKYLDIASLLYPEQAYDFETLKIKETYRN
ncbi:hypothetical protein [Mucilaginibacter conchicola]|nr:hypothetical protein [Mucilaginibacter conchicola]